MASPETAAAAAAAAAAMAAEEGTGTVSGSPVTHTASFTIANFSGADLEGQDYSRADLTSTDFSGSRNLHKAILFTQKVAHGPATGPRFFTDCMPEGIITRLTKTGPLHRDPAVVAATKLFHEQLDLLARMNLSKEDKSALRRAVAYDISQTAFEVAPNNTLADLQTRDAILTVAIHHPMFQHQEGRLVREAGVRMFRHKVRSLAGESKNWLIHERTEVRKAIAQLGSQQHSHGGHESHLSSSTFRSRRHRADRDRDTNHEATASYSDAGVGDDDWSATGSANSFASSPTGSSS